jgi:hypothetical protein
MLRQWIEPGAPPGLLLAATNAFLSMDELTIQTVLPPVMPQLQLIHCLKCIQVYLGFRPNFQGPLFCHFDGKSLSNYQCTAVLKKTFALLGHDTANYKSHSFRIGMATT